MPEQFFKARNILILLIGLLLAWAFLGFSVSETDVISVFDVKFKAKHLNLLPYVLAIGVILSVYNLTIEWIRTQNKERSKKISLFDHNALVYFAGFSLIVFLFKDITSIEEFNWKGHCFGAGTFAGLATIIYYVEYVFKGKLLKVKGKSKVIKNPYYSLMICFLFLSLGEAINALLMGADYFRTLVIILTVYSLCVVLPLSLFISRKTFIYGLKFEEEDVAQILYKHYLEPIEFIEGDGNHNKELIQTFAKSLDAEQVKLLESKEIESLTQSLNFKQQILFFHILDLPKENKDDNNKIEEKTKQPE